MTMTPDEAIAFARQALSADLQATSAWTPATQASLADALADRRSWLAAWPEGAEHVPGLVAQDVQEAVQARVDRRWPLCAEHADHALVIEPDLGPDPFWVCEIDGLPVAPIGGL